jgi:hypothetical protein
MIVEKEWDALESIGSRTEKATSLWDVFLVIDFVNVKIKLTQFFKDVYKDRIYVYIFIELSTYIYILSTFKKEGNGSVRLICWSELCSVAGRADKAKAHVHVGRKGPGVQRMEPVVFIVPRSVRAGAGSKLGCRDETFVSPWTRTRTNSTRRPRTTLS